MESDTIRFFFKREFLTKHKVDTEHPPVGGFQHDDHLLIIILTISTAVPALAKSIRMKTGRDLNESDFFK